MVTLSDGVRMRCCRLRRTTVVVVLFRRRRSRRTGGCADIRSFRRAAVARFGSRTCFPFFCQRNGGCKTRRVSNRSSRLSVYAAWMLAACRPLGPLVTSKETFWPFFQGFETVHVDGGEVCEQIVAAFVGGDETKTFCVVKPFDCTGCHKSTTFHKKLIKPSLSGLR